MEDKHNNVNNAEEEYLKRTLFEETDINELKEKQAQETIDTMAEVHGEASYLIAAENAFATNSIRITDEVIVENKEYLQDTLFGLEFYEKELIRIRSFFRYEKIRYEINSKNQYSKSEFEKKIEELWSEAIEKNRKEINDKYRYPIRKRIEFIFADFADKVIENRKQLQPDTNEYQEFWKNIELYQTVSSKSSGYWYRFIRIMEDLLSFFRDNKPGTYGHLLWLFLYVSEISYFQSIRRDDIYPEKVKKIRESQPDEYWKEFLLNEESLNMVFYSFVEIQERKVLETNNRMLMCYSSTTVSYNDCREDYKRIKTILYRDKTLRREFIYTGNDDFGKQGTTGTGGNPRRKNGLRCFAILTNGQTKYVAISGNCQALYNLCRTVFGSKCSKAYKFIDWNDYVYSLYAWKDKMGINELNQSQTEKRRISKRISPPANYNRMFSCAERRLVKQYLQEKNKTNFIIISKKTPCYMCERVLNYKGIKCIGFENYIENNTQIERELDSFAQSLI